MPQASAFTNSVRAYSEGRNTKPQFPGNILNIDNLRALSCDLIPVPPPPSEPYALLEFYNNNTQLKVSWYNMISVQFKVDFYDQYDTPIYNPAGPNTPTLNSVGSAITPLYYGHGEGVELVGAYWYVKLSSSDSAQITSNILYNITLPPGGGI